MKNILLSLLTLHSSLSTLHAALPQRWDVDLAAQPPQVFTLQRPRGETYEIEAVLKNRGKPFEPAITNACIYWQTNGMENLYWSAPASVSNNVLRATWLPSMDPGATTVRGYIGDHGHIYAAAFQFRFIASPGAIPNELPIPQKVIDFAKVTVLNPPWSGGGGGGGVNTNAVIDIANATIETNDTVKSLSSSVSVLQDLKADKTSTYTKSETDAKLAEKHPLNGELNILNGFAFYGASGVRFGTDGGRYFFNSSGDAEFHDVYVVGLEGISVAMLQFGSYADREALERSNWNFIRAGSSDAGWHYLWDDMTNEVVKAKYTPSATDTTFSNAVMGVASHTNAAFAAEVLAVGLNIDTNAVIALNGILADTNVVAVIGEIAGWPVDPTTGATTIGSLLAALAAAVYFLKRKTALLETDGKATETFATDLMGKQVAKTALMIPLETVEAGTSTIIAEDGHAYAVTMTGTVTITMPTVTDGKAAIFQARFSGVAQQSVQFDTDDVVKFDGMDCGIVKAGKDALLSAMWNGEAWDLVWKNQA